ncbi:PAS domain-containing hybrid sensor histidine kinase/response regulator [Teredinibacter sp. KSP-S5-2]|uniref:PAS domain-containing hybrid sensor histidine kinase/response regulator n=1 Tax=Teredinibacter sp. KSP-S5-2 TaxID=3034506 RepID=UPI0029346D2C|nr:ATP-binding protein [Teredinibacter sp. KSP-S5-2]WNO11403.1 ATP-binding protein [Teredinibacter sp. KSP-S5-2]
MAEINAIPHSPNIIILSEKKEQSVLYMNMVRVYGYNALHLKPDDDIDDFVPDVFIVRIEQLRTFSFLLAQFATVPIVVVHKFSEDLEFLSVETLDQDEDRMFHIFERGIAKRFQKVIERALLYEQSCEYRTLLIEQDENTREKIVSILKEKKSKVHTLPSISKLLDANLETMDLILVNLGGKYPAAIMKAFFLDHDPLSHASVIFLSNNNRYEISNITGEGLTVFPVDRDVDDLRHLIESGLKKAKIRKIDQQISYKEAYERNQEHITLNQHALVSISNAAGDITYVNGLFCEISGYTADQLIGKNHRIIKSGAHPEEFYENIWQTISTGHVWKGEICNRKKNGDLYWVDSTISPFMDDQGKPYQYVSIRTDITKSKAVEQNLEHTMDLLERTNEVAKIGHWSIDVETMRIEWSKVTRQIHDVDDNFQPTLENAVVFYEEGGCREQMKTLFQRAIKYSESFDVELIIHTRDGEKKWVRTIGVPDLNNGKCVRVFGVFQDVSDIKKAEYDLIDARNQAEKSNKAKTDFLSNMSHELRTPLNAIIGFSELLDLDASLNRDQKDNVEEINKAGQHLLELVNEILDLARIEAGELTFSMETINTVQIVNECTLLLTTLIETKNIHVNVVGDTNIHVKADRKRLKQSILNLLSNAIKYNTDSGNIEINISEQDMGSVRISVTDTGPGIDSDKYELIFQPFLRLHGENDGIEGTGIGLALTKKIIESMSGSIGVISEVGSGSTFWIDLPLDKTPEVSDDPQGGEVISSSTDDTTLMGNERHKILYIEDNPANLKLMMQIVASRKDTKLLSALTPQIGIEFAKTHNPELIMLDINLPEMDGYQLLDRLKSEGFSKTPFVAISANAMPEDVKRGKSAGFDEYLTKPINIPLFNEFLDNLYTQNQRE